MIVLKPISTEQEVAVFVRKEITSCDIIITDEQTQDDYEYTVTGVYKDGQLIFDITHTFEENRFYFLQLNELSTGTNLNKSKIFVTAQENLEKYSLTEDFYTIIEKDEQRFIVK